jgi:hypothetical protein
MLFAYPKLYCVEHNPIGWRSACIFCEFTRAVSSCRNDRRIPSRGAGSTHHHHNGDWVDIRYQNKGNRYHIFGLETRCMWRSNRSSCRRLLSLRPTAVLLTPAVPLYTVSLEDDDILSLEHRASHPFSIERPGPFSLRDTAAASSGKHPLLAMPAGPCMLCPCTSLRRICSVPKPFKDRTPTTKCAAQDKLQGISFVPHAGRWVAAGGAGGRRRRRRALTEEEEEEEEGGYR